MKKYKIWLKILLVPILACLLIFLIYTDKTKLQLKQPEGEPAEAEEVLILINELSLAGVEPVDKAVFEDAMIQLENLVSENEENYICYDLYCTIRSAFLGKTDSTDDERIRALYDELFYEDKYKEDFWMLKEDWYQGYQAILKYYDFQDVIREETIEILCTNKEIVGDHSLENNELLDTTGKKYVYLSEEFQELSYTVVKAYVRENRLLVCRACVQDAYQLKNIWLMESEEDGIRFFFKDYELIAGWKNVPESPQQYREQIADLVFSEGCLKEYTVKRNRIAGKILRLSESEVEIEGHGTIRFQDDVTGYRLYDVLKEASVRDLPVGYDFADFVIENGEICSFLILRKENMENIRVLIKTNGFSDRYHEVIEVSSREDMILTYGSYKDRIQEKVPAGTKILLTKDSDYLKEDRLELATVSSSGRIEVSSLSRSQGTPSYRGKLEISVSKKGLILINEVLLEEYLYSVVPSEMPASYPEEALAAQAVCARTYAYQYLLSPGLGDLGAHVDDSTTYQVYNNIAENVSSTKAVKETSGNILVHENEPVSTYYYSTSCGYGADEHVWNKEPERELTYLQPVYLAEKSEAVSRKVYTPEELCEEENFRSYISSVDENAFEKKEAWYRWSCKAEEIDAEELHQRLADRYQATPDKVLTYIGDADVIKYAKKEQKSKEAGNALIEAGNDEAAFTGAEPKKFKEVYAIVCVERLPGGVMDELLLVTDKGTYKVISEYNIRYILNQNCRIIRQDGSAYEGSSLLPSAYFVLDVIKDDDCITGYQITGGGYGHGAGMSQNGAKAMAAAGYSAEGILTFFFRECRIEERY